VNNTTYNTKRIELDEQEYLDLKRKLEVKAEQLHEILTNGKVPVVGYLGLIREWGFIDVLDYDFELSLYDSGGFEFVEKQSSLELLKDFKKEVERFKAVKLDFKSKLHRLHLKEGELEHEIEKINMMYLVENKSSRKWKITSCILGVTLVILMGYLSTI